MASVPFVPRIQPGSALPYVHSGEVGWALSLIGSSLIEACLKVEHAVGLAVEEAVVAAGSPVAQREWRLRECVHAQVCLRGKKTIGKTMCIVGMLNATGQPALIF